MNSLLTVNNNVSLISVNVAPSSFLAAFIILIVFLALYIPRQLPAIRIPRLAIPALPSFLRPDFSSRAAGPLDKPLPDAPGRDGRLVFQDQSLVLSSRDLARLQARSSVRSERGTSSRSLVITPATMAATSAHTDDIDASLMDFELPPASPLLSVSPPPDSPTFRRRHHRHHHPHHHQQERQPSISSPGAAGFSSPEMTSAGDDTDPPPPPPSDRLRDLADSDSVSAGGYSPPAWRRLGNGDRSSGFWRGPDDVLGAVVSRWREASTDLDDDGYGGDDGDCDEVLHDETLERAMRTQLPRGSQSPGKGRSMSPEKDVEEDVTLKVKHKSPSAQPADARDTPASPPPDNYIRFALRADVQQRTEPLEAAVTFLRRHYRSATSTWSSTLLSALAALLALSLVQSLLLQPPARRPAGDLVKVAGIARSFEPLIYYSENAVSQSQDLQATSVAVWDLGESVRISGMRDAGSIVADLDALSETMKTLSLEMTKFFARVDGDVDGVLNVMDWAKMHLNRLNNRPPPSTISSAYDNIHNLLSQARVFEDATGAPTALGALASRALGPSNPQREQRAVQRLFTEFLAVLEDSVEAELRHSVSLFALFEQVDARFLNLARAVAREDEAHEDAHADLLASLWTRILGAGAASLRKYERNRLLLRDVRAKTVRNKASLVDHNSKLLTLKASLEGLRSRLVSPLLRGVNSTTLTLDDQIRGLGDVSDYLTSIRRQQRAKVWEKLFATDPNKRLALDPSLDTIDGKQ